MTDWIAPFFFLVLAGFFMLFNLKAVSRPTKLLTFILVWISSGTAVYLALKEAGIV